MMKKNFLVFCLAAFIFSTQSKPAQAESYIYTWAGFGVFSAYPEERGISENSNSDSFCSDFSFICRTGGGASMLFEIGKTGFLIGPFADLLFDFNTQFNGAFNAMVDMDLGLSAMFFPGGKVGEGMYIRGTVGRAQVQLLQDQIKLVGLGVTGNLGYAFQLKSKKSFLIGAQYSRRNVSTELFQSVYITFGWLY